MEFAIVENNIVINIAESMIPLESNWYKIPSDVPVYIGDTFDGRVFYDENGQMRVSYVQSKTNEQITDLESAFDSLMGGVSVALGL